MSLVHTFRIVAGHMSLGDGHGSGSPGGGSESYSAAAPASITEGIGATINVTTTGLANGTELYWTLTPSGEYGTSSGSFSISDNAGTITLAATAADLEGSESGTIEIRTDSISGPIVASDTFTINDDANGTKYVNNYGAPPGDYYVVIIGSTQTFTWYGISKGSNGGGALTPGDGYTYSVGTTQDTVSGGKGDSTYYHEIIRSNA
jgi:hypothetical protein